MLRKSYFALKPAQNFVVDDYSIARRRMVKDQIAGRGIAQPAILQAMLKVPRHCFVEEGMRPMAYSDRPLHIGQGQTISQPYIVARMLERLAPKPGDRVLEIGTGCGYQTALLAEIVDHVYSVERISQLILNARKVLKELRYPNITLKLGDGTLGWPKYAPFNAMIVCAGGPTIPQPYLDQLAEGGRLILPVGDENRQSLVLVLKREGQFFQETLSECRFVKLKGEYGFATS